jgi:RHS repeat-associated protein
MYGDRLGSIIALADDTGTVSSNYKYSPWGESYDMSGTTFGFTGQRFDGETGLYYFKNRHLSPKLGRFLQPDPLGYGLAGCGCGCDGMSNCTASVQEFRVCPVSCNAELKVA